VLKYLWIIVLLSILGSSSAWSALTRDIGIADFVNRTPSIAELNEPTKSIPTLIFTYLARSQKLSLVDRQALNTMLDEMMLAQTGVVDPETAAQVGRAVGARHMFIGQLSGFQGKKGLRIVITTQLVDVESTRVIAGWPITASPTELDVQASKLAQNILAHLFPVGTWSAAGRSLVIPGWGQFANKRASGYVFLPLAVVALGGLAYTQYAYVQANDDYEEVLNREFKTYSELQKVTDRRDARNQQRWFAAGTLAGVWLVNVVDAFLESHLLNKQQRHAEARVQLQARVEPQNVQVLWTMRF